MGTEIWKPKKDYEGLYEVSNFGNVMSLNYRGTGKSKLLKPNKNKKGYLHVSLCKNGKLKTFRVNRLVAETFIPNPDNLPQVNHKDENKENNSVENLEWCTPKYNCNYGTCIQRRAKTQTNGKRSKIVLQFTLDGELVKEWSSRNECERNGFNRGGVYLCCIGKKPQYKGFIWRYK